MSEQYTLYMGAPKFTFSNYNDEDSDQTIPYNDFNYNSENNFNLENRFYKVPKTGIYEVGFLTKPYISQDTIFSNAMNDTPHNSLWSQHLNSHNNWSQRIRPVFHDEKSRFTKDALPQIINYYINSILILNFKNNSNVIRSLSMSNIRRSGKDIEIIAQMKNYSTCRKKINNDDSHYFLPKIKLLTEKVYLHKEDKIAWYTESMTINTNRGCKRVYNKIDSECYRYVIPM